MHSHRQQRPTQAKSVATLLNVSVRISRQGPFSNTKRPVWQRQTEQGGVCRWLRRHAYHHRQACACRCHTAARIFSQTLARRVCQDFRAAFPCGRRPPGVAASKLVLSEAERIRRTWGWIASQRPFRTDAPLPFAIPKAPLHYALRLPPTCHDIFTHTRRPELLSSRRHVADRLMAKGAQRVYWGQECIGVRPFDNH